MLTQHRELKDNLKLFSCTFLCITFLSILSGRAFAFTPNSTDIYDANYGKYTYTIQQNGFFDSIPDANYSNGNFISRQNALKIVNEFLGKNKGLYDVRFDEQYMYIKKEIELPDYLKDKPLIKVNEDVQYPKDIDNSFIKKDIEKLYKYGILEKTDDKNLFRPNDTITKAEFGYFMYAYLKAYGVINEKIVDQTITDIGSSLYKYVIQAVVGNGVFALDGNGRFHPDEKITIGKLSQFLVNYGQLQLQTPPPFEKKYTVLDVPWVSQLSPVYAPIGCEPTSLYASLKYKGYVNAVSHRQFLDNMPYDYIDPRRGFVGHYSGFRNKSKRETIFPNALASYGGKYGNAQDFSGKSVSDIQTEVCMGNPVVAYVTFRWASPVWTRYYVEGNTYTWVSNNHVVVVCGYDPATNRYYVSDPYAYSTNKYWVSGSTFEWLYNARKHAIVVR